MKTIYKKNLANKKMSIFYLYRQRFPAEAPQSIQILSTAHAISSLGVEVWLYADPPLVNSFSTNSMDQANQIKNIIDDYGLCGNSFLHLNIINESNKSLRGFRFRYRFIKWLRYCHKNNLIPIVFSRRVDYATTLLKLRSMFKLDFFIVHEWHYLKSSILELEAKNGKGNFSSIKYIRNQEKTVWEKADGHIVITPFMKPFIENTIGKTTANIICIPNASPSIENKIEPVLGDIFFKEKMDNLHDISVVYAGLFRRVEDLDFLIKAFKSIPKNVKLQIIGADESKSNWNEARKLNTIKFGNIEWIGAKSPKIARAYMQNADIGVATFKDSLNMDVFASPLKILEYKASNLAIVSTDHKTTRLLISHEKTGLLAKNDSSDDIAKNIMRLVQSHSLRKELARNAKIEAEKNTWLDRAHIISSWLSKLFSSG